MKLMALHGTRFVSTALFSLLLPLLALGQSVGGGKITGQVSNAATKYFLEGAVVQLAGSNRITTTDREGRYHFNDVPAETVTLVASFTGLDPKQIPVPVQPGQTIVRDVELTAGVYKLETFRVVGEREGSALAITRQRAAANVKNIVATDAFGTQTEDNVGSFLQRLPGVTADFSTGSVREVMVRGINSNLNTVEMDGVQLANTNSSGTNRFFDFLQASISLVESIEVTKAPTPDMPASSIGGSINMVTRTAFGRNAPRLFTYSFGLVHAIDRIGGRAEKGYEEPIEKVTPSMNFSYADLVGQKRNLGILMSFSRNTAFGSSEDALMNYQQVLTRPAFIRTVAVRPVAVQGPHTRQNESVKLEYKLNDYTVLTLNAVHNLFLEVNDTRTLNLQGANATTSFAPGYSETYSEALRLPTTVANMAETSYDNVSHNYRLLTSAVHRLEGMVIDYSGTASFSSGYQKYAPFENQYGNSKPKGTITVAGLSNIGFIIDRRQSAAWPTISQTAGPDVYNLGNYTTMTMAQNNRVANASIMEARFNVRKNFSLAVPAYVKAGLQFHQQRRDKDYSYHSYTFTGPGGLAQFLDQRSWVNERISGMRQGPWVDVLYVAQHKEANPQLWTEDLSYKYAQKYLSRQDFREEIKSAYIMGNTQISSLNILGGIRVEDSALAGNGPITRLTAAEQARRAAWVGPVTDAEGLRRAEAQYGTRVHKTGGYQNVFPGIHFKYAPRSGLVARASHSTSIGRAPIDSTIPNLSVNDTAQTITVANTALKPQYSKNFDVNLEYYYEPIGLFSASAFLKELSGFIYSDSSQIVGPGSGNGYDGLYENYHITTSANGGHARYRGFELNYQQQFTFLPGIWSGFGVNLNYTQIETKGDYGGAVATTKVAGFRPKTANLALSYQKNRYKFSMQANWVDTYLTSVSTNAALILYQAPRTFVGAKFTYTLTNRTNLYLNWDNITKAPVNSNYAAFSDRVTTTRQLYSTIGLGIQGRF
jgi:TonB-dependent receptor